MTSINEATLLEVERRATGQPYSVYAVNLLQEGILYYEVDVSTGEKSFIAANGETIKLSGSGGVVHCSEEFNEDQIARAIQRTQQGITTYQTFLEEIGEAGVHSYVADLENKSITYRSHDTFDRYTEVIPNI